MNNQSLRAEAADFVPTVSRLPANERANYAPMFNGINNLNGNLSLTTGAAFQPPLARSRTVPVFPSLVRENPIGVAGVGASTVVPLHIATSSFTAVAGSSLNAPAFSHSILGPTVISRQPLVPLPPMAPLLPPVVPRPILPAPRLAPPSNPWNVSHMSSPLHSEKSTPTPPLDTSTPLPNALRFGLGRQVNNPIRLGVSSYIPEISFKAEDEETQNKNTSGVSTDEPTPAETFKALVRKAASFEEVDLEKSLSQSLGELSLNDIAAESEEKCKTSESAENRRTLPANDVVDASTKSEGNSSFSMNVPDKSAGDTGNASSGKDLYSKLVAELRLTRRRLEEAEGRILDLLEELSLSTSENEKLRSSAASMTAALDAAEKERQEFEATTKVLLHKFRKFKIIYERQKNRTKVLEDMIAD